MRNKLLGMVLLAGLALGPTAAVAQSAVEGRVDRLEREMRAVQRKVFPGGNSEYFPPDITPDSRAPGPGPNTSNSGPLIDLTARVSALETQVSSVVGQVENVQHQHQQLLDAFNAYKRTTDARIKVLEEAAATPAPSPGSGTTPRLPTTEPKVPTRPVTPPTGATTTTPGSTTGTTPAKPKPATTKADPARARLVAAVERPSTSDPADDAYVYGYRLWQAKLYPEAVTQLKEVVAKYPKHRRASWAQNLIGRSYLDDGKPSLASLAFYDNYDKFHEGERTPDSLFFLSIALKKLGKPSASICQVYDALDNEYASRLTSQMKTDIAAGRATEKCKAK